MKVLFFMLTYCILPVLSHAQVPEISAAAEQQLETGTEKNTDVEPEDDSFLQQMQTYSKHPVNLNTVDEDELKALRFFSPLQIQNLLMYRNFFGKFISIYELQAIPNWDIELIQRIRPYITINEEPALLTTIGKRLHGGEYSFLARIGQTPERSKGFLTALPTATNFYPGSPQKIVVRYKYQYKHLLQYGIVGEKDAGEQFFKGNQKQGFDFYSVHFFASRLGVIKALALGDFTVNLGQGLTQWQSLAFKKSSDVMNIKREGAVLRPYNSAGEINFHRGIGVTLAKNRWLASVFASYKKIDANFIAGTSLTQEDFVSSLQTSGYHRTKSETDDKGVQQQIAFGGNFSYQHNRFHIGLNGIGYKFKLPLHKSNDPYNLYSLNGKSFGNYSIDYCYTYNNVHFFGEAAANNGGYNAFVNGILISTASDVDMSFLYRNISKGYQSLYTNAFTENVYPTNEKGFYIGLSIHPGSIWQIHAYADFYKFPWLKYSVDAPSNGSDYLIQLTYKPNKKLDISTHFRSESKAINSNSDMVVLSSIAARPRQSWRVQFTYKFNVAAVFTYRSEMLWFNKKTIQEEHGFLTYVNFLYKALFKHWSSNFRLQYFETDSYNSRLYAYENDVLYSFSIPVFYDKAVRYYINTACDVNKKLKFWIKWSQTLYKNKTLIGSGLEEIGGSRKSEIKVQVMYKF